jgi:hypothetical protein
MWRWENGEKSEAGFFLQRNIVIPKKGEMGRVRLSPHAEKAPVFTLSSAG